MRILLKILLPLLVLVLGALGTKWLIDARGEIVPSPPVVVLPTVRTLELASTSFRVEVLARGSVMPRTQSALVAEVGGRVIAVSPALVAGGFFAAGEVLLELDPRDGELALAQAKLQVAQAVRKLSEIQADAAVAKREWAELGEGQATALGLLEPQVAEAGAALNAAQARESHAQLNIERTQLVASFAGRVRAKYADLGQYIPPGSVLAELYAVDYAEVRLPISDSELAHLEIDLTTRAVETSAAGPRVRLWADFAGARREWTARIVRTEGEIDPLTRMVVLVARVEDPYDIPAGQEGTAAPLTVGLFVEAAIEGRMLEDVRILPRSALRDGSRVYLVSPENTLQRRTVEVLRATRENIVVAGTGLPMGTRVIVSPLEIATEGMRVKDISDRSR